MDPVPVTDPELIAELDRLEASRRPLVDELVARGAKQADELLGRATTAHDSDAAEDGQAVTDPDLIAELDGLEAEQSPPGRGPVGQFFEGFNQTVGNIIRAPEAIPDLVFDTAYGALGGDVEAHQRKRWEMSPVQRFLQEDTPAQGPASRIAETAGEFLAENIIPAAVSLGTAPAIAAARGPGVNLVDDAYRSLARGIRNSPNKAAAGEGAATFGAGIGTGVAQETAPDSPAAQVAGGLLGAAAPTVVANTPSRLAYRVGKGAIGRFMPSNQEKAAKTAASSELAESLTPERMAELQRNQAIADEVPGTEFSLAELTDSPSLIRTQQQIESEVSGAALERATSRYQGNRRAIEEQIRSETPGGSASRVLDASARRLEGIQSSLDDASARATGQERFVAESLPSGTEARQRGSRIRDRLIEARAVAKNDLARFADDSGLNDEAASLNAVSIRSGVAKAYDDASKLKTKTGKRTAAEPSIIRAVRDAKDVQTFPGLMELRSDIAGALDRAIRLNHDDAEIRGLAAARKVFDDLLDDTVAQTTDPDIAQRYREFRELWRRDFVEPFETGAAYRVLQRDATRAYRIRDEMVAAEFFKPGDEQAALQYRRIFGGDREANTNIAAAALDSLNHAAVRDGRIHRRLLDAWKRRHGSVLKVFPHLERRVANVSSAIRSIAERQETLKARGRLVEHSMLARDVRAFTGGTRTPEAIINDAIRSPARLRILMRSLKDPASKDSLARVAWESVLDVADVQAMRRHLNTHESGLRLAMGAERFERASRLVKALEMAGRVGPPRGKGMAGNPLQQMEEALGTGLNQISSRIFAVQSGRTSARFALFDVLGRALTGFSRQRTKAILSEAIYDPRLAHDLARFVASKSVPQESARRLFTYLYVIGLGPDIDQESGNG